jgi:hypothetical protein
MHPALAAMLTQTMTHEAYQSQDSYGTPVYGSPRQVPARVEYRPRRVLTQLGEERTSRARIYVDGDAATLAQPFDLRDRIRLPDGTVPALLEVAPFLDEQGVLDHWRLTV